MNRRNKWLLAAAVLLGLAALLMSRQEPVDAAPRREVQFPRGLRATEYQRMESRRTLSPPSSKALPAAEEKHRRDPVLAALGDKRKTAVVIEANAIRHSPIGELLVQCFSSGGRSDPIAELREHTGIDVLTDVDRIAMTDRETIVSGHFQNARWDQSWDNVSSTAYGDKARLYTFGSRSLPDGPSAEPTVGIWNGQMVIFGDSPDRIREAVDRLEGRASLGAPAIPEELSYGEIYGVISADQLMPLIRSENAELAERLRKVTERIEIHIDARKDVAVVASVKGPDAAGVSDLGKSLGGMLSLARLHAQARGDHDLAELLDLARIQPGDGLFHLELALPIEFLEKQLAHCRRENRPSAESDR